MLFFDFHPQDVSFMCMQIFPNLKSQTLLVQSNLDKQYTPCNKYINMIFNMFGANKYMEEKGRGGQQGSARSSGTLTFTWVDQRKLCSEVDA